MTQVATGPAFPFWRKRWAPLHGLQDLLTKADAVLQRRMAGNQRMVSWTRSDKNKNVTWVVRELREWASNRPPAATERRTTIVRIHALLWPALHAAQWSRWLLLERALFDGSATGDLQFSALTLRTMCEEVQRLYALDYSGEQLAQLASSGDPEDLSQLQLFLSVARISLDELPEDMILHGANWPSLKRVKAAMSQLESARSSLNNYVHPNYGSHIAALFPERTQGARSLLQALIVVYESFLDLSWTDKPGRAYKVINGIEDIGSWSSTIQRFKSDILPDIRDKAEDPVLKTMMELPNTMGWLAERPDLEEMLAEDASDPLVVDLPRQTIDASADGTISYEYELWDGARAYDVLSFAAARCSERRLAGEFPSGVPDTADQSCWLRFNALAIELAMLISKVKEAAFKTQLLRQITLGNPVGIMLCVRTFIEHRAFAVHLTRELQGLMKNLADKVRASEQLPGDAVELGEHIVKFLAFQGRRRIEDQRSWAKRGGVAVQPSKPKFEEIMRSAFSADDQIHVLYALGAAAIHGRSMRGFQVANNIEEQALHARFVGLLVLERFCDQDDEIDHLSEASRLFVQLQHAADIGGTLAATTDTIVKMVFGRIEGALSLGIDYTGLGTRESPFCFGPHLEPMQSSFEILNQLGAESIDLIEGDVDVEGNRCLRYQSPNAAYWFRYDHSIEDKYGGSASAGTGA